MQQEILVTELERKEQESKGRPKHAPFLDFFLFAYWGVVAVIAGLIALLFKVHVEAEVPPDEEKPMAKASTRRVTIAQYIIGGEQEEEQDQDEEGKAEEELPRNMWSLILIASIGQAKFSNGRLIPAWCVCIIAIFMGIIQIAALFLMCHDLDPTADPYTVQPSSPYGSGWSVNSMKVIMTIFMVIALVSEAGQCQKVFCQAWAVNEKRLIAPRAVPLVMEGCQYLIAIAVVWAGVSVILSFQSVPDIIYSSMSIMCISNVDEMFFECVDAVIGLEADFVVRDCSDSQTTRDSVNGDSHYSLSGQLQFIMKFLLAFPVLFGIFLFLRAWYTGFMPTDRIHAIIGVFN